MFVFASQSTPKMPKYSHTFAVMLRVQGTAVADVSTISWMPADLQIKPLRLSVEPGINEPYQATFQRLLGEGRQRISLWGPFEAAPVLYERFVAQKSFLESGAFGYQCIDCLGEAKFNRNGGNCMHALKPLHGFAWGDVLERYGDAAGEFISRALIRDGLAVPFPVAAEGPLDTLGIASLPIVHRTVDDVGTAAEMPIAVNPLAY